MTLRVAGSGLACGILLASVGGISSDISPPSLRATPPGVVSSVVGAVGGFSFVFLCSWLLALGCRAACLLIDSADTSSQSGVSTSFVSLAYSGFPCRCGARLGGADSLKM